jgi:hypothetical protein
MSETWGLPETPAARRDANGRATPSQGRLSPKVTAAAHKGIVWLHLVAVAVWLLVAAALGALAATGRDIPTIILIVALGAAAGHGLFLVVHRLLAATARSRAGKDEASRPLSRAGKDEASRPLPSPAQPAPVAGRPDAGEPLPVGALPAGAPAVGAPGTPGRRPEVPVRQK